MITYTWSFPQFYVYPQAEGVSDVVFVIFYTLTGTDENGVFASLSGSTSVTYKEGEPFTPFNEITESQCIAWTESSLGEQQIAEMQLDINNQIQAQLNPPYVTLPAPWTSTQEIIEPQPV